MNYDLVRVRERIQFIESCLTRLEELKGIPYQDFTQDFRNIESGKHLLQVAIEAMMDVGSHILARNRLATPQEGSEVFRKMGESGFIDSKKVPVYIQMVGFRNRLVHLYHDVDNQQVYEAIQNSLDDFRVFIREIWEVVGHSGSEGMP